MEKQISNDPELYLIKLYRKAIHHLSDDQNADLPVRDSYKRCSGHIRSRATDLPDRDSYKSAKGSQERSFLAMDYFDVLIPQEIKIEEDINTFMDVFEPRYKKMTRHDVAMHSIPIYCTAQDIEAYEKPIKVSIKGSGGNAPGSGGSVSESRRNAPEQLSIYDNPFEQKQYPYLSLIQVYIAPEIMARIKPLELKHAEGGEDGRNPLELKHAEGEEDIRNPITRSIVDQFYEDLHKIVNGFAAEHYARDRFKCRIYRALSAGDFTVAISCNKPETPFFLATLFRARGCSYEVRTGDKVEDRTRFIFYKTYTLLSCDSLMIYDEYERASEQDIEEWEAAEPESLTSVRDKEAGQDGSLQNNDYLDTEGVFVLRVAFSSKYWAEKAKENSKHSFHRLHGRYDFSVHLKENEFRFFANSLCAYKLDNKGAQTMEEPDKERVRKVYGLNEEQYTRCKELITYITEHHVAYINERYIFSCPNMDIFPKQERKDSRTPISQEERKDTRTTICQEERKDSRTTICQEESEDYETSIRLLEESRGRLFLTDVNENEIQKVERRLDKLCEHIMWLTTNRRNIFYYLNLLRRMLDMCRSINGLSDTRIYCTFLIHQIDVVIDGVEDCYDVLLKEENRYMVQIMEHAFVEAVNALDTYAKLIRDNNLQSLQTPNYNLQSSVGVEKILVGYGELLNSLFRWYEGTDTCNRIYGLRQRYTPFMIPGVQEESLQTKVLFKEVQAKIANEKLMVVWCSSFSDLTNFGGTIGILFHEVAHNLRYKSRPERNEIILRYCTYLICDQITQSIMGDLERNIPSLKDSVGVTRLICDSLYTAYDIAVYKDHNVLKDIRDYSYASVIDYIWNEYGRFVKAVKEINDIDKLIYRFVNNPDNLNKKSEKVYYCVQDLRKALIDSRSRSFRVDDSIAYSAFDQEIVARMNDAIAVLDDYLHGSQDGQIVYTSDLSAKAIYNALNANKAQLEDFRRMLPRYGMVDRFFELFADQLSRNIQRLDSNKERKNIDSNNERKNIAEDMYVSEGWKVVRYLTKNSSQWYVKPTVLAAYTSPYIVITQMEAESIISQATTIYSEVASDLFMYNLMEMTPFGYFRFLSEYVPTDGRMAHTYVRRFCTVMYAAFSEPIKDEADESKRRRYWSGLVESLFCDFVKSASGSFAALSDKCGEFHEEQYIIPVPTGDNDELKTWSLQEWCGYISKYIMRLADEYLQKEKESPETASKNDQLTMEMVLMKYAKRHFDFLRQYTASVYEIVSGDASENPENRQSKKRMLEEIQEEIGRWSVMTSFLGRICQEIIQEITTIESLGYMAEDYRDGYKSTKQLLDEFTGNQEDYGEALLNSPKRKPRSGKCWLEPYFKEVKEILNNPEVRYNKAKCKTKNSTMIEMILELYYKAVHDCAIT